MNRKGFSTISIIILCMIAFLIVNAQSKIDDKESARIFVQNFYNWYGKLDMANVNGDKNPNPYGLTLSHKPAYLDNRLLKALMEDQKAGEESTDGINGLDFDPFTNAQDVRTGYQTGLVSQKGDKFFVDVHDITSGQSTQAILKADLVATVEVAKVNGHWVFMNILYPKADRGYNLLEILEYQKKERAKWAKEKS